MVSRHAVPAAPRETTSDRSTACHSERTGLAETGPNGKNSSPPCPHRGQRPDAPPSPGPTAAPTAPAAVCMNTTADRPSTSNGLVPTAECPSQTESAVESRERANDDTCTDHGAEPLHTKPDHPPIPLTAPMPRENDMLRRPAPTNDADSTLEELFSGIRGRSTGQQARGSGSGANQRRNGDRNSRADFNDLLPKRPGRGHRDDRPEGRDARFGSRPRTLHGKIR